MKIALTMINNNQDSEIYKFIKSISKFNFIYKRIEEINKNTNELTFIIANKKNSEKQIKNLNKLSLYKSTNLIFLIPSSLKLLLKINNNNVIYFPININDFEKKIFKYSNNISINFDNFTLNNQNLLFKNDSQYIYLTEPEAHIIKLLFLNKLVNKDKIKLEVLKLNTTVESKSLETHLYRLRKKLLTLGSNILIRSDDNKLIFLTEIGCIIPCFFIEFESSSNSSLSKCCLG